MGEFTERSGFRQGEGCVGRGGLSRDEAREMEWAFSHPCGGCGGLRPRDKGFHEMRPSGKIHNRPDGCAGD